MRESRTGSAHRTPTAPGPVGRFLRSRSAGSMAAVALLLVSALAGTAAGAPSSIVPPAAHVSSLPHHAASAPTATRAPSVPVNLSSGPGTFFTTYPIPLPSIGNNTCPTTYECFNDTNEPAMNLTSGGLLAMAYTAFTNETPCPAEHNTSTTTQVGFVTSSNLGTSWSKPRYLGNADCSGSGDAYESAFQPSLTSLANGTLVLAYVQYNWTASCTGCYIPYPPNLECYSLADDRIVVMESYDNGTNWTAPKVLDNVTTRAATTGCNLAGFPDLRPSIAATGDTVYVAWENVTGPYTCGMSSEIWVRTSSDGGASWTAATALPFAKGTTAYCYPSTTGAAENPYLLIDPSGELFIAYTTNFSTRLICAAYCYYASTVDVDVAASVTNATSFTTTTAASQLLMPSICCDSGVNALPFPTLAYGATYHQLYLSFEGSENGLFCFYYSASPNCYNTTGVTNVFFTNSSTNGASWSPYHPVSTDLVNPNGGPANAVYHPSMAVDAAGVIHFQAAFMNDSICSVSSPYGYPYYSCGGHTEVYLTSGDNGSSFSTPVDVGTNASTFVYYGGAAQPYYDGTFTSTLVAGGQVLLGWVQLNCVVNATNCDYGYAGGGSAQVMVSKLYQGSGVTLTFHEKGLGSGIPWSASVLGNYRAAGAPSDLTVSGVPPTELVNYTVPWVNQTWGVTYNASLSQSPPAVFPKNTTVDANFSELVRFTIDSNPAFSTYYWQNGFLNQNITPGIGSWWEPINTSESLAVAGATPTSCYPCYNLTFLSWTGVGPGSTSSSASSISTTLKGPVNETANFRYGGACWSSYYNATLITCLNASFPLNFTETGLPAKTKWSVTTFQGLGGAAQVNSTTGRTIAMNVPNGETYFYVWTVPAPNGKVWVPSTNYASPVTPPETQVDVTFTLENASASVFPIRFVETGLPNGTDWSLTVAGTGVGVTTNATTLDFAGGGPYSVSADDVYQTNGVGYRVYSVAMTGYVENASVVSGSAGVGLTFNGSSTVTLSFAPMYLLTVTASVGGTAGPAAQWVDAGSSVGLTENASSNFHFVGWTGVGSGSTTTAQDSQTSPTISPGGPVTEFATFRPNAPPTWNLTVTAVGLPAGTQFDFGLGGAGYSGTGSVKVGGLLTGTYGLTFPYLYLNASQTTRYLPQATSDLAYSNGVLDIVSNGSVTVNYSTEQLLTVGVAPVEGGTTSVGPGSFWYASGTSVTLVATPSAGYYFVGWSGSGSSGVSATTRSIPVTLDSPVAEAAYFALRPIGPPATYWLQVSESGLPNGTSWNVSLGALGATGVASGGSTALTVRGLNGSYVLGVPAIVVAPGVRYVAAQAGATESVTANGTLALTFSEQFDVVVTSTAGGSVNGTVGWVAPGTSVTLTATPNATSVFVNWTGTGAASVSGDQASISFTASSAVTEVAEFGPIPPAPVHTSSSGASGMLPVYALLGVLLVVGLAVGLLVGRRRPPAPESVAPEAEPPADYEAPMLEEGPVESAEYGSDSNLG